MIHKDIIKRIHDIVRMPLIFRNINYSRVMLAKELGISERLLVKILNIEMQTDFHTLVNTQRAHYAHRVLKAPAHINQGLEDIALFCGFTSRLTMHRHFTRIYGISPGKYKRQNR